MSYAQVFAEQLGDVHRELAGVINELPAEALNWIPYEGGNSIAVLVTHLLGNELETLRVVRGMPTDRVRSAEFEVSNATRGGLLALLAEAEAVSAELTPRLTVEDLDRMVRRPAALGDTAHSGLYQLEHSLTHASEHYGQICMTRDLWGARSNIRDLKLPSRLETS
jgi:uncharacterized damage-inducible protein DinB